MSWTAPASRDKFHYANGTFFVDASGPNQHARTSVSELQTLLHLPATASSPPKVYPAHWYEAQLLHYGLPASKVKGTAAKRLLDALNGGTLVVPKEITAVEKVLKKEWNARARLAKMEAKPVDGGVTAEVGGVVKQKGKKKVAVLPAVRTAKQGSATAVAGKARITKSTVAKRKKKDATDAATGTSAAQSGASVTITVNLAVKGTPPEKTKAASTRSHAKQKPRAPRKRTGLTDADGDVLMQG